jgi:hypothetical protein
MKSAQVLLPQSFSLRIFQAKLPLTASRRTVMNPSNQSQAKNQPTLTEIMSGFLRRQTDAHRDGLAGIDLTSEVQPYEAGPVQPIDARPAWEEATAVLRLTKITSDDKALKAPPNWPTLVAAHEPAFDLTLSLGNFPQLVRDLHRLLAARDLNELRQVARTSVEVPALVDWSSALAAKPQFPQLLVAVGALRLARQFERAEQIIKASDSAVPTQWRALWENEKAALAWHRGDTETARRIWQSQPESVVVWFNRGMSALFTNRPDEARTALGHAVTQLPETSAWHHLARLYLTLAESRGQ